MSSGDSGRSWHLHPQATMCEISSSCGVQTDLVSKACAGGSTSRLHISNCFPVHSLGVNPAVVPGKICRQAAVIERWVRAVG